MRKYNYTLNVLDGNGKTWCLVGIATQDNGDMPALMQQVMAASFQQLTQGGAQFGKPGEGGCRGPYRVTHLAITEETLPPTLRPVHPAENIGSTTRDHRARPLGEVLREDE